MRNRAKTIVFIWIWVSAFIASCSMSIDDEGITFIKTFGGSSEDVGHSCIQTNEEGYIICGNTNSYGSGLTDIYVIKTDRLGDVIWSQTYGGSDIDYAHNVQATSGGGYVISGTTYSYGQGESDLLLLKIDGNGTEQWLRTYGGSYRDSGQNVLALDDGGFLLLGHMETDHDSQTSIFVLRTDELGNEIWSCLLGSTGYNWGYDLVETSDQEFVILGSSYPPGASFPDIFLYRLDRYGNEIWTKKIRQGWAYSLAKTDGSGFIICGTVNSQAVLIKTDGTGYEQWTVTFSDTTSELATMAGNDVKQTLDGGYILTGYIDYGYDTGSGITYAELFLLKTDWLGNLEWKRTYSDSTSSYWNSHGQFVQQTSDTGFITGGQINQSEAFTFDIYLVKTDQDGKVASSGKK